MTPDQVRGWLVERQQECDAATDGPVPALIAMVTAVLDLHRAGYDAVAKRLGIEPYPGDVCVVCAQGMPCDTVAALAAAIGDQQ